MKNKLSISEENRNTIVSKLKNSESDRENIELKIKENNAGWEKKVQSLNDELGEVKTKLSTAKEVSQKNLDPELHTLSVPSVNVKKEEVISINRNAKKLGNKGKKNYSKLKESKNTKNNQEEKVLDTSTSKNEELLDNVNKPELLTEARGGKKDNLTLVKGIGKVLEERLNNLGIYHFDQIASWSATEQSWMDERMSFPGRVEREEWVKQSAELAVGVETEFSKRVKDGAVPSSKEK